ncbi:response regulator [Thiohalorhabdus sp. Cl-TMA]|uniref:Response regulator n=1 Tax=Thiohalorhabdus methylotrophus TaxID=3242694 RepID=A0ABV4TVX2_9GAMM
MKVLLVDDSRAMRMVLKSSLRKAGFSELEVVEAENGQDAQEKLRAFSPEVILSDWNMPVMDGLEFLRHFRSQDALTPFVFITTEQTQAKRREAVEAGANKVVGKPFTPQKLYDELSEFLS